VKKEVKILLLALTAGVGAAGAYAYVEYRKERLAKEAARLWEVLGLRPGARVGDVGAGAGEMAALIAARVGPAGRVFATEADTGRLRKLIRKRQKDTWDNIALIESRPEDCNLPPGTCDAVYMRGVYHHLTDPAGMDASLLRALRLGGTLAVIDFPPRWLLALTTPKDIPKNRGGHGIRPELVIEELERAGFELVRTLEDWPAYTYCVVLQKPITPRRSE
jgi:ubiquinone/menaquinone biosynthesis C-methylase UbiE